MPKPCFRESDSDPPVYGVHKIPLVKIPLVQKELALELIASGCKAFAFLVCPVGRAVLDDEATAL
jgi:hypothetical protein